MANGVRRVEPVWLPTRVKNFAQRARLLDSSGRETASWSDPAVVHLTHQELANMIGICRQTATLFLGRFRDEGILDTGKGYIKLYDLNRLRTLAAEEK